MEIAQATQINNDFARRHRNSRCSLLILHVYETRIKLKRTKNMWSDELSYLFASIYGPWDHLLNSSFVYFVVFLLVRACATTFHLCNSVKHTTIFRFMCAFCLRFVQPEWQEAKKHKITCTNTINDLSLSISAKNSANNLIVFGFIYWPYCDLGTNNEIQTTVVYVA